MREAKQVIVMRRCGMRRGKEIAQGGHSVIAFLKKRMSWVSRLKAVFFGNDFPEATRQWMETGEAKICVKVDSENELLEVYNNAKGAGLEVHLITDSGKTEFAGVPTKTCLAIGPNWSDDIDKITGHLKLY